MITIETEFYEMAHGKLPRGTGCWAFEFKVGGTWVTEFAPGTMTLAKAKAWARGYAALIGAFRVQVGS